MKFNDALNLDRNLRGGMIVILNRQERLGAPLPRFPAEACGVDTLHAPFLNEGAHADLSSTAWQEIGVKPYFGLSGIPQHSTLKSANSSTGSNKDSRYCLR